jgi:L-amino acid N-acyltransferase YncA
VPPTTDELRNRWLTARAAGLPYLAADAGGRVIGYAYASAYRARPGYRYTVEDSVYVAEEHTGRGVGSALLRELIGRCEAGPWRQMLAIIGDSANVRSIALHRGQGFELVGTFKSVGFKLGRWVDTVMMQRTLGVGDARAPQGLHALKGAPAPLP